MTSEIATAAEQLARPLDWCRGHWLRFVVQSRPLRETLRDADRRIALLAALSIGVAAVGAVYLPVLLFGLAPVLLGVAHVASDLRYLVLRRSLPTWWKNGVWLGCALLLGLRVLEEAGLLQSAERLELVVAATFVAVALLAALAERGSHRRASVAFVLLCAATGGAWLHPSGARLCLLHAHNLVALGLWATLFRAHKRLLLGPAVLVLLVTSVLASGALYRQTLTSPGASAFHLHVLSVAGSLTPFRSARWAIGLTSAFLFLQSLHYSVWLSFIPQEEQASQGTPTFRMSVRSLFRDLGLPGVAAVGLAALAVLLGACVQLQHARGLYMSLASFHTYLELALWAYFWIRPGGLHGSGAR